MVWPAKAKAKVRGDQPRSPGWCGQRRLSGGRREDNRNQPSIQKDPKLEASLCCIVPQGEESMEKMTQRYLACVVCPLVYDSHLSSTDLCLQVTSHHMSEGHLTKLVAYRPVLASRTMGTSLRSQSFREPRSSYGRLHESQGRSLDCRLHRALSLRQGREKSRSQGLDGTEGLEVSVQERLPGTLGDTEQLIESQRGGGSRRWLRQYKQVWLQTQLSRSWGRVGTPGSKGLRAQLT